MTASLRAKTAGRLRGASALLVAALLAVGCGEAAPRLTRDAAAPVEPCDALRWTGAPPRNVVLVVSDTMRPDRLGAYGGPARTDAFDALAREHLRFDRASTQAPWTKPAVATLFTGLQPSQHGVSSHPDVRAPSLRGGVLETDVLADELVTLAERFRSAGFRTAAFVANPWIAGRFGFAQGFDTYQDGFAEEKAPGLRLARAAAAWLREAGDEPFFLYLHAMDAHSPYGQLAPADLEAAEERVAADRRPLDPLARAVVRAIVRYEDGSRVLGSDDEPTRTHLELVYDRGIENFDRALAELLDALRALPAWEETAVIVTSDHGEALYERGWIDHGFGFFEDETAVPLAARLPGVAADGPVACPVGLVDLVPTLCAYAGLGCEGAPGAGVSWLAPPSGNGARPARYLVTEAIRNKPAHRALRNGRFKLLYEPQGRPAGGGSGAPWALFDLEADPAESRDLLGAAPRSDEVEAVFRTLAEALRASTPAEGAAAAPRAPVDDATRRRLRELGYLE